VCVCMRVFTQSRSCSAHINFCIISIHHCVHLFDFKYICIISSKFSKPVTHCSRDEEKKRDTTQAVKTIPQQG
jgi:hypothetical protein